MSNVSISKATFDRKASVCLKGIAIILMMFHHNFRDETLFNSYTISFVPFSEAHVVAFAYACKICVSLFAFITGYGLYINYRESSMNATKWIIHRYIKTFSGYWFVWICSAVLCQLINGRTTSILFRDGKASGIVYTVIDFLGLAKLFSTPSLNGTWWYMSAAAVFILLIPLLYLVKDDLWLALIGAVVFIRIIHNGNYFPGGNSVYAFLTPFILGSIFARYSCFEKLYKLTSGNKILKACKATLEILLIVFLFMMYEKVPMESFWEFHFCIFPLVVILFCVEFVIPLKPINIVLAFFGKHSMNVFLIHTFFLGNNLSNFTYSWGHFILITFVLLIISTVTSIFIDFLKKIVHYPYCIKWILNHSWNFSETPSVK